MDFKNESIIVSAVRTFCKSFAAMIGIALGLLVLFLGLTPLSTPDIYPPKSSLIVSPDANGNRDLLPQTAPVILKIDIKGVIGQGDLTATKIQNALLDSREGMLSHDRVKAVLLFINTPGGLADDSAVIYKALMDYKEKYHTPIFAYVEGMCASGGMYIACAADRIFASAPSMIGSVGAILGPTFNFSGLMDRYGVQSLTITEGKDKDMLNPYRPWRPGEEESIRNFLAEIYDQFVSVVIKARPRMNRNQLIHDYGAQVYIANKAEELGYIDVAGTDYSHTITELAKAAKIDQQPYQVFTIEPPRLFLAELAGGNLSLLTGKLSHSFQVGSINSELSGRFLYLYQPGLQQ